MFGVPPIECEYGQPNCLGGSVWGGHIIIPNSIMPPSIQTVHTGILQTIVNTMRQQTSGTCQCVRAPCDCAGNPEPLPVITPNITQAPSVHIPLQVSGIITQTKTWVQTHPLASLLIVGGIIWVATKK